jgi:hypothetical protein
MLARGRRELSIVRRNAEICGAQAEHHARELAAGRSCNGSKAPASP